MKKSNYLFQALAVLVLVAIAACMMVIGRGHTVYFDTHEFEKDGKTYKAPYKIEIYVPGKDKAISKLYDGERGSTTCIGQKLEFSLVITEKKGGDEQDPVSYTIELPYNMDGIVFNLPAFLNGVPAEQCYEEFVPAVEEVPQEEVPSGDGLGMDGMDAMGEMGDI